MAVELAYVREMRSLTKALGKIVEGKVIPAAAKALPREDGTREDALPSSLRAVLASVREQVRAVVAARIKAGIVTSILTSVDGANLGEMSRVLGLDRAKVAPSIGRSTLREWQRENVDLIRNMADRYVDEVEELVDDALVNGRRVESLARDIEERTSVSASRARLIARDQTLKANAQLSQARMREVGVTSYRWSTSKDERVREGHAKLEGRTFRFADPPVVDPSGRRANPGQDFQCRCVAIPVLDD